VKIVNNNEFHTVRGYQLLDQNKDKLTSSMEDYLEMIYRYSLEDGYIRINLLAELLHVKAASASRMVQKLGEIGLLNYKKYGIIILSENGKKIGEYLLERHHIIENFLKIISCEDGLLEQTELMEHNISPQTVHKINTLIDFFDVNKNIAHNFKEYQKKSFTIE
jgi:DtxR family transcriptional regulator, Mn-dependent transcriptional regulator